MIKVKNLKKSFNNKPILKGISCEFEKGKTSLIIGQTGSGKTVFLKCLLGLHPHDEGQIIFDKSNFQQMNDNVTPPEVAYEFHKLLPNSDLFWIDKCGHAPMMEHPNQFNVLLNDWLSSKIV